MRELHALGRDEIPSFQVISHDQAKLTQDDRWKTFFLYGMGNRNAENCARCPVTDAVVRRIPGTEDRDVLDLVAWQEDPAAHRALQRASCATTWAWWCRSPKRCTLRVGNQTRQWKVGASLLFDDTFEHEVDNDSAYERVVLFIDVLRPLHFPMQYLNRATLEALRRSPFVSEAEQNLLRFNAEQRAAALARLKQTH